MMECNYYMVTIIFLLLLNLFGEANSKECDYFRGKWVFDNKSYPLYESLECPFVRKEFSCIRNGRPDKLYQNYKWQPHNCQLPKFDGRNLLEELRGKSVMFVGDSISQDQWESLACILHKQVPQAKYILTTSNDSVRTLTFTEYGVRIMVSWNQYLVDIVQEKEGRILKLDSVEVGAKLWNATDILIFNSWHWWYRKLWDYVEVNNVLVKKMDGMTLFEEALNTWARWADKINPSKTRVFFQGISPTHYNGSEWNEHGANSCIGQTKPILGMSYPGGPPLSLTVMKRALRSVLEKKTVTLLDITELSQLRKDGHPSVYGQNGHFGEDCLHWCLGGVPDTWNEILYALLFP